MKNLRFISDTYRQPIVKTTLSFDLNWYAFKGHLEAKKLLLLRIYLGHEKLRSNRAIYTYKKKCLAKIKSPLDEVI